MTLVTIKKQDFETLNDERLGWACVEPILLPLRGKEIEIKHGVISKLTKGQKALCMFRVLYDHANNSLIEYYSWVAYLLDNSKYWDGVLSGLQFFGDKKMLQLLEETKMLLTDCYSKLGLNASDASYKDLEQDDAFHHSVKLLYVRFLETSPASLNRISNYIRTNPQEFVILQS